MALKSNSLPHALVVREFDEFRSLVRAHAVGHYELMAILGPPGVAKTETVTRIMQDVHGGGRWASIRGKHTPLDLYRRLFENRLHPIVLDDLDGLLAKSDNTAILKCVCDTRAVKRIEWGSNHAAFSTASLNLPKSFESISRVCLIANDWSVINKNVAAIHDRGLVINFRPTALQVHAELAAGGWFNDAEVFDFIGRHLHLLVSPSFRFYITAREHRRAGLDWRGLILRTIESAADRGMLHVARLLADPQFDTLTAPESARENAFRAAGGGSRATYHRHKRALLASRGNVEAGLATAMKLAPAQPDLLSAALAERRQHFEALRESQRDPLCTPSALDEKFGRFERKTAPLEVEMLRIEQQLRDAISREDYEAAAALRDELRRLKEL